MTLHQFSIRLRQGRKLGVLRNTRPQRISFPRFSAPSFPFCSIPKTENSEFSLRFNLTTIFLLNCVTSRILTKLRSFVFALYPIPKTRRWKTSEFDLIITVFSVVQNGKLGVGKPRRLIKVPQSLIKIPHRKSARFSSPSSRFWLQCKMEKENLGKIFSEVSEISENSEFSTLPSEFCSFWIELSVVLYLLDRKVRLMANDLFYSPGSW